MHCAIIGAGAWGTAMAVHLCRLPYVVTLVTQRLEQALELTQQRNNWQYLPDTPLAPHLQITCELQPALMSAEVVFLAVPGKALRDLCTAIRFAIPQTRQLRAFIILSKGLEPDTGLTPCEVVDELLPEYPCAILSGPTFAGEIAAGKPAALVCGSTMEEALLHNLQRALNHRRYRRRWPSIRRQCQSSSVNPLPRRDGQARRKARRPKRDLLRFERSGRSHCHLQRLVEPQPHLRPKNSPRFQS